VKHLGCVYFDPGWILKDLLDGVHLCQVTSKSGCCMSIDVVDLQIAIYSSQTELLHSICQSKPEINILQVPEPLYVK
jgi:hypothetical protein